VVAIGCAQEFQLVWRARKRHTDPGMCPQFSFTKEPDHLPRIALGVTVDGERDVLGLWAGEHGDGEGAKYWMRVCPEIKNRGVRDVCMLVCDGLKGLPDAVNAVWEKTIVQTCIVHLLRNSFKYASKKDWAQIAKDLKPVYTAASETEALDRFAEFSGKWEKRYPRATRPRRNASHPAPSSEEATSMPRISRLPSALTPVAIRACTFTVRPPSRTFWVSASIHRNV